MSGLINTYCTRYFFMVQGMERYPTKPRQNYIALCFGENDKDRTILRCATPHAL